MANGNEVATVAENGCASCGPGAQAEACATKGTTGRVIVSQSRRAIQEKGERAFRENLVVHGFTRKE